MYLVESLWPVAGTFRTFYYFLMSEPGVALGRAHQARGKDGQLPGGPHRLRRLRRPANQARRRERAEHPSRDGLPHRAGTRWLERRSGTRSPRRIPGRIPLRQVDKAKPGEGNVPTGRPGSAIQLSKPLLVGQSICYILCDRWLERGGPTRSHPEHGSETSQR